jgi:hypothetical protein
VAAFFAVATASALSASIFFVCSARARTSIMSVLTLSGAIQVVLSPCCEGDPLIVSSVGFTNGRVGVVVSGFIPHVRSVRATEAPVVLQATGVIQSPLTGVAGTSIIGLVEGPGS